MDPAQQTAQRREQTLRCGPARQTLAQAVAWSQREICSVEPVSARSSLPPFLFQFAERVPAGRRTARFATPPTTPSATAIQATLADQSDCSPNTASSENKPGPVRASANAPAANTIVCSMPFDV